MLTVHHLNNSRSQRVLWLLEELGVPYGIVPYQRDPKTLAAPAALRAIHPLGKSPIITDEGRTIAETGTIVEYILDRYGDGRMRPSDPEARLRYLYWLHFAEGSAMPPLVMTLIFSEIPKRMPGLLRPIGRAIGNRVQRTYLGPMIEAQVTMIEAALTDHAFFAGPELSGADIMMSFPVEALASRRGVGATPKLAAWLERIQSRPAYARALERGGPYAYASRSAT